MSVTSSKFKKIALGADHGGFSLKETLKEHLKQQGSDYQIYDFGTYNEESVDYPDFANSVVDAIRKGECELGILCCGTGIGISMMANRYKGIRAAVVYDEYTARMSKAHNNANVLCLGGRTIAPEIAKKWVDIWLHTSFKEGRHTRRVSKLDNDFLLL